MKVLCGLREWRSCAWYRSPRHVLVIASAVIDRSLYGKKKLAKKEERAGCAYRQPAARSVQYLKPSSVCNLLSDALRCGPVYRYVPCSSILNTSVIECLYSWPTTRSKGSICLSVRVFSSLYGLHAFLLFSCSSTSSGLATCPSSMRSITKRPAND
jgi:hypothetical protein